MKGREVCRVSDYKPPRRKESEVQRAILAYLGTRGDVVAWRANSRVVVMPGKGGRPGLYRMGFKGQPDIVGYRLERAVSERHGMTTTARFLAIEVKAEGKEHDVSPEQRAFLDKVKADGGIAVVASCVADVAAAL